MEVTATVGAINNGITRNADSSVESESRPNAFGIGSANRTEVELSPQARVLQQVDENQRSLREQFEQRREDTRQKDEEQESVESNNGYVRVSSSEGSTQKNNLSAEKAAEVYQAISRFV